MVFLLLNSFSVQEMQEEALKNVRYRLNNHQMTVVSETTKGLPRLTGAYVLLWHCVYFL